MDKHKLAGQDVCLCEVQDRPGGGTLEGQVSIGGRGHDELQLLWRGVFVLSVEVLYCNLCDGPNPHLRQSDKRDQKERESQNRPNLRNETRAKKKGFHCNFYI